eukprot:g44086.t1
MIYERRKGMIAKCLDYADSGKPDEYAITLTDFISKCVEDCVPKKSIRVFSNRKPWMNREIHSLLKTRHAAFKSDNPAPYRKFSYDLHKAIRNAKRRHCCRCQIGHPDCQPKESDRPRVPGYALRSCADQQAKVFTDSFNPSLLQAKVPTYFKKTTTFPIPKKACVMCLNDYRPVIVTSITMKCFERLVMVHINSSLLAWLNSRQYAYRYAMVKKEQQRLFFLRRLRKFGMSRRTLTNFYSCTIESMLSGCITTWYSNSPAQGRKKQQKMVCTAQTITEANIPSMDSIYTA